jgi:hypothetical protein
MQFEGVFGHILANLVGPERWKPEAACDEVPGATHDLPRRQG